MKYFDFILIMLSFHHLIKSRFWGKECNLNEVNYHKKTLHHNFCLIGVHKNRYIKPCFMACLYVRSEICKWDYHKACTFFISGLSLMQCTYCTFISDSPASEIGVKRWIIIIGISDFYLNLLNSLELNFYIRVQKDVTSFSFRYKFSSLTKTCSNISFNAKLDKYSYYLY